MRQPLHLQTNQEEVSASPSEPNQQQKVLRNLNHKNQNEDPGDPEPTVSGSGLGEPGSLPEYGPCPGSTEGPGLSQAPPLSGGSTAQGEKSWRMSATLFARETQAVTLPEKIAALDLANER